MEFSKIDLENLILDVEKTIYGLKQNIGTCRESHSTMIILDLLVKEINLDNCRDKFWIAGGVIQRIKSYDLQTRMSYKDCKEKLKQERVDFDFYFKNREDLTVTIAELISKNSSVQILNYSGNSIKISLEDNSKYTSNGILLDFVCLHYPTLQDVFNSFDFTICKIGYNPVNNTILSHTNWDTDYTNKKLVLEDNKLINPLNTMMRLNKYIKQGYTIDSVSIKKLAKQIKELEDIDGMECKGSY